MFHPLEDAARSYCMTVQRDLKTTAKSHVEDFRAMVCMLTSTM